MGTKQQAMRSREGNRVRIQLPLDAVQVLPLEVADAAAEAASARDAEVAA